MKLEEFVLPVSPIQVNHPIRHSRRGDFVSVEVQVSMRNELLKKSTDSDSVIRTILYHVTQSNGTEDDPHLPHALRS